MTDESFHVHHNLYPIKTQQGKNHPARLFLLSKLFYSFYYLYFNITNCETTIGFVFIHMAPQLNSSPNEDINSVVSLVLS